MTRRARITRAAHLTRSRTAADDDGARADLLRVADDLNAGRITLTPEHAQTLGAGLAAIVAEIRKDNRR